MKCEVNGFGDGMMRKFVEYLELQLFISFE